MSTRPPRARASFGAVLGAVALTALTACGATGADTGLATLDGSAERSETDAAEAGRTSEEQLLEFVSCMREHGVDLPEPEINAQGELVMRMQRGAVDRDSVQYQAAIAACEDVRPDFGSQLSPQDQSEMEERMLAFAACMRERGVDMADPDFSGGGGIRMGAGIDMDDPAVQAAVEHCSTAVGVGGGMGMRGGS